jgi:hypothetical protein
MNKKSKTPYGMMRGIVNMYKDSIPGLFQQCPFTKGLTLNITVDNKVAGFLPEGTFQFKQINSHSQDKHMFVLIFLFVIEK